MFKKLYIILCLLFIINSCSDNSITPIHKGDCWIVNIYCMKYDNVNQKWDLSSKCLIGTCKYDGKTYFPEGDYKTMYGKNYWNHDHKYKYKKNFGNLLEDFISDSYGINLIYKYHYDEKGYLSKAILDDPSNKVIDTTEYINENGKLIEKRKLISNNYSKYEYGTNDFIYKILHYDSNNILITYNEFKYDNNDYIIEKSGQYIDSYGNKIDYIYNYKYNSSGYLIERILDSYKEIFKYDSNNLLIERDTEYDKNIYKYDNNNYLIEIINYDEYDKLICKSIYENLQLTEE